MAAVTPTRSRSVTRRRGDQRVRFDRPVPDDGVEVLVGEGLAIGDAPGVVLAEARPREPRRDEGFPGVAVGLDGVLGVVAEARPGDDVEEQIGQLFGLVLGVVAVGRGEGTQGVLDVDERLLHELRRREDCGVLDRREVVADEGQEGLVGVLAVERAQEVQREDV